MVLSLLCCVGPWAKAPQAISDLYWKGAGETLLELSYSHDKHQHLKAVLRLVICTRWFCVLADHLLK